MQEKPKKKHIIGWIFLGLAVLVLTVSSALFISSKITDKPIKVFGFQAYMVMSGSMDPHIKIRAVVVTKDVKFENLEPGDIISFRSAALNGETAIHRIVKVTEKGIVTKGDNNRHEDGGYVTPENYLGKVVFHTNIAAYYVDALCGHGGPLIVVAPAFFGVALFFLFRLGRR